MLRTITQQDLEEDFNPCPMCDGNDHELLGVLGKLAHLRCGACGFTFHIQAVRP